ncbi:hypothetical protein IM538_08460 [Cytobacillus suaedae]|nr:hypothetical protein IM538_08460 [Cytobacillus suaedae]
MNKFEVLERVHQLEQEAFQLDQHSWFHYELFTFEWWILVIFTVAPWILWIMLANRQKMLETVLVGTLAIIPTTLLDSIGLQYEFWIYPTQLLPVAPRAIPFDMSMVPVAFMLIYQYFETWKSYTIALLVTSTLYAFVGEPFSVWMELVRYINWNYFYSFCYYLLLGFSIRALLIKLRKLQNNSW